MDKRHYQILLFKSSLALLCCTILVILCYYYVDKPVAFYVFQHRINLHVSLASITRISEFFYLTAPAMIIFFVIVHAWHNNGHFLKTLLVISLSVIITAFFKNELKFIFGRYWPLTWKHNLSLIKNNAYGFNFLHGGNLNNSFPSGHTALAFAAMTVIWIAYPRLRWLSVIVCAAMMISLVGMDYHFVSDVIAGAFLGAICAVYTAAMTNLKPYQRGNFHDR